MKRIVNYLRGSVEIEAAGPFPERFLNLCARRGIVFWGVEWQPDGAVRLTVARRERPRLEELGARAGCTVEEVVREGLPSFLARFRTRYALLIGLALSLLAVLLMTQFVLVVDVSGNERVSSAAILSTLRRLGVRPGAFGPAIDVDLIEQQVLLEQSELSWIAINLYGARAEVLVRERVAPPEVVDESAYGDVVADRGGVITRLEVLDGETEWKVGAAVAEGDLLISGNVLLEGPMYSEQDVGWRQVRARGRVWARTWRTLEAQIPLEAQVKTYTGARRQRCFLEFMGRRVNFYGKSGIPFPLYDKISEIWSGEGGGWLIPVSVGRETIREYTLTCAPIDQAAAEDMLRQRLEEALRKEIGQGSVVSMDFSAVIQDGVLKVTLNAQCSEEIGCFVPFEKNESHPAG
ncbi:sporulation protein [Pseudoflavonifractor sp. 524-17]|uniref:sporulation protein YqfD n=1 Tax=Pseudoflavonifractor sp. 524-17 TaxID=2304577 RepID=UPI00137A88F4|nr:sporulation protein YqfD [Pseudoflavonifractor sp. 524-17]NCE64325.1 sporulation protein [Pseudoflavonifractor sp. 524-17]